MNEDKSFAEYLQRLKIQDLLIDAGYQFYRKDGLRYPAYIRTDSEGKKIPGDKFLVNPRHNTCCKPPTLRSYNVISLIQNFPEMFPEYQSGKNPYLIVNEVCRRLLNMPPQERQSRIQEPSQSSTPFELESYALQRFNPKDFDTQRPFYPYFVTRGINMATQRAFHEHFYLASRTAGDTAYANLAFPLTIPGEKETVGLELRGRARMDGTSGYKGMAPGSNSGRGLWIASPGGTPLDKVRDVYIFESAYDAMAYYQLQSSKAQDKKERNRLYYGVYISTGGHPSVAQIDSLLQHTPRATYHVGYDSDAAGRAFAEQFSQRAELQPPRGMTIPEDMQDYMASLRDRTNVFSGDPDLLPMELLRKYATYESHAEEYESMRSSRLSAPVDTQEEGRKMQAAHQEYDKALLAHLGLYRRPEPIQVIRELPEEGCKDWNEQLLAGQTRTEAQGADLDGNGQVETSESQQEEKKETIIHTRHTR